MQHRGFLSQTGNGIRISDSDLATHWNISQKTAKRDIADLKQKGLIEFSGAPKNGYYRLRSWKNYKRNKLTADERRQTQTFCQADCIAVFCRTVSSGRKVSLQFNASASSYPSASVRVCPRLNKIFKCWLTADPRRQTPTFSCPSGKW